MIFQEMLRHHTWDVIWAHLVKKYPDQFSNLKGYRFVYHRLLEMQPKTSDAYLKIINVAEEPGAVDPDVFMMEKEDNSSSYTDFSLSGVPWEQLIGLPVDSNADQSVPEIDAIVYALFKLTYFGFTEPSIAKYFSKLLKGDRRRTNKKRKNLKFSQDKSQLFWKKISGY